jgi:thiol-disulfide isomerase/thioredoxin
MTVTVKRFLVTALLVFSFYSLFAQTTYITSHDVKDSSVKILKGIISKSLINHDTSFNWYQPSYDNYFPDSGIVNALKRTKDSVQFVLFGGTWCEDTQFILPKFFKLQDSSGVSDDQVTFFGVDRKKKTLGNIADAFNITNVPTIIVMKDGKELGRVVEYGVSGQWDKDLEAILLKK